MLDILIRLIPALFTLCFSTKALRFFRFCTWFKIQFTTTNFTLSKFYSPPSFAWREKKNIRVIKMLIKWICFSSFFKRDEHFYKEKLSLFTPPSLFEKYPSFQIQFKFYFKLVQLIYSNTEWIVEIVKFINLTINPFNWFWR